MNEAVRDVFSVQPALVSDSPADVLLVAKQTQAPDLWKRSFDVVASAFALVLLLPLLLLVTAGMLMRQGRPIFIAHKRVGRGGKLFACLKFRTMVVDAERAIEEHLDRDPTALQEWRQTRKLRNDPRVTPLGRVLRRSSVDELPQLFNVLRGEMSLVGPRPIVEDEIEFYGPFASKYLQVRPGLTGLWQISGRSDLSYGRRVQLDVAYVEKRGFLQDIWILLRTIPAVLRTKGAH